jgi:hypothetical protein
LTLLSNDRVVCELSGRKERRALGGYLRVVDDG